MGPLDLLNHLLNFVAPALVVGILVCLSARVSMRRTPTGLPLGKQMVLNVVVGTAAMAGGLLIFGRDGKMASYAALVICCATSQWCLSGSWRK
jgi:hypothetical protein